jgi:hypothetical protein
MIFLAVGLANSIRRLSETIYILASGHRNSKKFKKKKVIY